MLNLKNVRKSRGVTQVKVSEDLNIHRSTYNGYEQGTSEPNIETIKRFVDYFDCSFEELLGIEKKTNNNVSPDKQQVIDRIGGLTQIECIKVGAYIDALLVQRKEKRQNTINSIINDSEDTIV